ncbi:hypothetical protein [Undibacterium baiyunense]|uniref:Uncharacterized protein n=1 Tax=Undibacterium baiyunense TaxID=2828731 RepID=A0A941DHH9_9BURK|nr:hypothetical protein [Undibacterium baiyunense]MBR7748021.1 hypothetical protein [Undibacterium baiyunense]
MKDRLEKLSQLAVQSAGSAGRGLLQVQSKAQDLTKDLTQGIVQVVNVDNFNKTSAAASSIAIAASKSVHQSLSNVIEHETTQAIVEKVKERGSQIADTATQSAKAVSTHVIDGVKKLDEKLEENHLEIKEKTETVSMGLGIAAGVAAGAAIIGPPIVVAAAPVIGAAATVTGAVAGSAYFYSKWKSKQATPTQDEVIDESTSADGSIDGLIKGRASE